MAEDAVQRVRRITQRVQRVLQNQHVGVAAAAPHGGVACRRAAARGLAVPPVKVYPGGCHRQRLHVTPRPGPHSGVVNFAALCGSAALPHVERHARIVLARRAVAALPDALEGVPHRDTAAVGAAGQVPRLHGSGGRPEHVALAGPAELPHPQRCIGAVGHRVVLTQSIAEKLVVIGVVHVDLWHSLSLLTFAAEPLRGQT